jgi:hypothetical protein
MPCDGGDYSSMEYERMRDRLDKATRVACEMEKMLTHAQRKKLSPEAQDWIIKHREADERRLRNEEHQRQVKEERATALKKLTPRERALLNIGG